MKMYSILYLICLFFVPATQCMLTTYHHTLAPYHMHRLTVAHFSGDLFTVGFSNGTTGAVHIIDRKNMKSPVCKIKSDSPFFTIKKLTNPHLACSQPGLIKIFDIATGQSTGQLHTHDEQWAKYMDGHGFELYTANAFSREIVRWDTRIQRSAEIIGTVPQDACVSSLACIDDLRLCWTEDVFDDFYLFDKRVPGDTKTCIHHTDTEKFLISVRTRDIHSIDGKGAVLAQRAYNGNKGLGPWSRLLMYTSADDALQPFLMASKEQPIISLCILPKEEIVSLHKKGDMFCWDTEECLTTRFEKIPYPAVAMASSPEGNLAWITEKKDRIYFMAQNETMVSSYAVSREFRKSARMYNNLKK